MRRPCETTDLVQRADGKYRSVKHYSYVMLLTKIDDDEVMAVRYDGYSNKEELVNAVDHPGWNCKGIWKLYDNDFREKE